MGVPRYWREIPQRYNLIGRKCGVCGKVYFPPRSMCPKCRRASMGHMEEYKLKGTGVVESYTVIYAPPPHFEKEEPYVIALIKPEEETYLTAQIVDVNPDEVSSGMCVEACFRRIYQDGAAGAIQYGYKFKPVE